MCVCGHANEASVKKRHHAKEAAIGKWNALQLVVVVVVVVAPQQSVDAWTYVTN